MIRSKEYLEHPGISQSDLKLFEDDICSFYQQKILGIKEEEKQSTAFDIGNLIDALLLDPEALKDYYVVTDLKASGKVKDVVDLVVKLEEDVYNQRMNAHTTGEPIGDTYYTDVPTYPQSLTVCLASITTAVDVVEYQKNWKDINTRINKIVEMGAGYYKQCLEARGKIMVPLDNWNKAHTIVDNLKDDEYTANIFAWLKGDHPEEITVHCQKELFGYFEDEKLKGILDFYFRNKVTREIWPWDLKTSMSLKGFKANYKQWRYGRQGTIYTELLQQSYPGDKIHDFSFLAIPTQSQEFPERFVMSRGEMILHSEGYTDTRGYRYKGWKELLREVSWHRDKGLWNHRQEYYINGINVLETAAIDDTLPEVPVLF